MKGRPFGKQAPWAQSHGADRVAAWYEREGLDIEDPRSGAGATVRRCADAVLMLPAQVERRRQEILAQLCQERINARKGDVKAKKSAAAGKAAAAAPQAARSTGETTMRQPGEGRRMSCAECEDLARDFARDAAQRQAQPRKALRGVLGADGTVIEMPEFAYKRQEVAWRLEHQHGITDVRGMISNETKRKLARDMGCTMGAVTGHITYLREEARKAAVEQPAPVPEIWGDGGHIPAVSEHRDPFEEALPEPVVTEPVVVERETGQPLNPALVLEVVPHEAPLQLAPHVELKSSETGLAEDALRRRALLLAGSVPTGLSLDEWADVLGLAGHLARQAGDAVRVAA